jgi:hypothetical protein
MRKGIGQTRSGVPGQNHGGEVYHLRPCHRRCQIRNQF